MSKAEKTKQYIIERVSPIFNKHGYTGTSLSQITDAIGLTKGAVYGNFDNKEDIALEALVYNFRQFSDEVSLKIKQYDNSCDKLSAFASYYKDNYKKISQMGGCPLLNAATENDDGNPALRKQVLKLLDFWETSLKKIVERGIKRKEIRADINPGQFASLFIELIEGGIMLSKLTGNSEYLSRAVEHIKEVIEKDLRK